MALQSEDARQNPILEHYMSNIYSLMFKDEVAGSKSVGESEEGQMEII